LKVYPVGEAINTTLIEQTLTPLGADIVGVGGIAHTVTETVTEFVPMHPLTVPATV